MRQPKSLSVVAHLLATAALAVPVLASAQSLPIGKALYTTQCLSCHGTPPRFIDGAQKGANSPSTIRSAINADKGGMRALSGLSTQDLTDIAAYLGNQNVPSSASGTSERILNWAEWKYQTALTPRAASQAIDVYIARHYSTPNLYVGMDGGSVYLYSPASGLQNLGAINNFLLQAAADGF